MKTHLWIAAACVLLTAGHSLAGVILGEVKDEDGKPVSGAEVKVYGKDIKAKSDAKGKFRIESEELIDGNRYSVTVTAEGYDEGQTLSTEVFDDPDDMEPLIVEMFTEEPLPEPTEDQTPKGMTPVLPGSRSAVDAEAANEEFVPDDSLLIPNIDEEPAGATNKPSQPPAAAEKATPQPAK